MPVYDNTKKAKTYDKDPPTVESGNYELLSNELS